jgi:acyl-CoA-binding protein
MARRCPGGPSGAHAKEESVADRDRDLTKRFEEAAAQAKSLKQRPSDQTLLDLYALYKQSTSGDASGERPGMFDLVGRAKYDAWEGKKGTSRESAMKAYIDLVESLRRTG